MHGIFTAAIIHTSVVLLEIFEGPSLVWELTNLLRLVLVLDIDDSGSYQNMAKLPGYCLVFVNIFTVIGCKTFCETFCLYTINNEC